MLFKKLHNALKDIVLDIDEEGYAANAFANKLGAVKWDSTIDHTEKDYEHLAQIEGVALLILLIDIVLSHELKIWVEAAKMVLKYGW